MALSTGGGGRQVVRLDPNDADVVDIGRDDIKAKLAIRSAGDFSFPQLHIEQTTPEDYARIRLVSTESAPFAVDNTPTGPPQLTPFWDIAVGGGERDRMNLFHQTVGDIVTLSASRGGGVGIRTTDPVAELDVNGTARMSVLEITGGTDVAESFNVEEEAEPGTVMVIDESNPDRLRVSQRPYDRTVAGVVAGAGGVGRGVMLRGAPAGTSEAFLALTGRVYCKADASPGRIRPGDLLTTSRRLGHAMKASDRRRTPGAVLGKAMTHLARGQGLVLVLVALQ